MRKITLTVLILLAIIATHGWGEPFKNNGNGTVTDLPTGLTWQQVDDDGLKTWAVAVSYCQGLGLAGGGWRLPTVKELISIVDDRVYNPAINSVAFPGTNSSDYWSATPRSSNSGRAWRVVFGSGYGSDSPKSNFHYVRCVR